MNISNLNNYTDSQNLSKIEKREDNNVSDQSNNQYLNGSNNDTTAQIIKSKYKNAPTHDKLKTQKALLKALNNETTTPKQKEIAEQIITTLIKFSCSKAIKSENANFDKLSGLEGLVNTYNSNANDEDQLVFNDILGFAKNKNGFFGRKELTGHFKDLLKMIHNYNIKISVNADEQQYLKNNGIREDILVLDQPINKSSVGITKVPENDGEPAMLSNNPNLKVMNSNEIYNQTQVDIGTARITMAFDSSVNTYHIGYHGSSSSNDDRIQEQKLIKSIITNLSSKASTKNPVRISITADTNESFADKNTDGEYEVNDKPSEFLNNISPANSCMQGHTTIGDTACFKMRSTNLDTNNQVSKGGVLDPNLKEIVINLTITSYIKNDKGNTYTSNLNNGSTLQQKDALSKGYSDHNKISNNMVVNGNTYKTEFDSVLPLTHKVKGLIAPQTKFNFDEIAKANTYLPRPVGNQLFENMDEKDLATFFNAPIQHITIHNTIITRIQSTYCDIVTNTQLPNDKITVGHLYADAIAQTTGASSKVFLDMITTHNETIKGLYPSNNNIQDIQDIQDIQKSMKEIFNKAMVEMLISVEFGKECEIWADSNRSATLGVKSTKNNDNNSYTLKICVDDKDSLSKYNEVELRKNKDDVLEAVDTTNGDQHANNDEIIDLLFSKWDKANRGALTNTKKLPNNAKNFINALKATGSCAKANQLNAGYATINGKPFVFLDDAVNDIAMKKAQDYMDNSGFNVVESDDNNTTTEGQITLNINGKTITYFNNNGEQITTSLNKLGFPINVDVTVKNVKIWLDYSSKEFLSGHGLAHHINQIFYTCVMPELSKEGLTGFDKSYANNLSKLQQEKKNKYDNMNANLYSKILSSKYTRKIPTEYANLKYNSPELRKMLAEDCNNQHSTRHLIAREIISRLLLNSKENITNIKNAKDITGSGEIEKMDNN